MNDDFITQRHQQLWSEQSKHMQRTIAATLIFSIVALFNILIPYKNNYVDKAELEAQIDSLSTLSEQSGVLLQEIDKLDDALLAVDKVIDTKPWDQKRNDLINDFRTSGNRTRNQQQEMADNTVKEIAAMVRDKVYTPLAEFLKNDSLAAQFMPNTTNDLKELPDILESWVNENVDQLWYETISMKTATVNRLTSTLDYHLASLSQHLLSEKDALIAHKKQIAQDIQILQNQTKVEQKKEKLLAIEAEMAKIMPDWLSGLVTVKQLVQYFPLIMAAMFFYILWLGVSLSKHYAYFAQSDPSTFKGSTLVASIWTMTDRGRGTMITAGVYLLLAIGLWISFEHGVSVLHYCLKVDASFNKGLENYMFLAWFIRLAMAVVLFYTVYVFKKGTAKTE